MSSIYRVQGLTLKALDSATKAMEIEPNNPIVHINLGVIYIDLGDFDKAVNATQVALKLNPENPEALINLWYIQVSG